MVYTFNQLAIQQKLQSIKQKSLNNNMSRFDYILQCHASQFMQLVKTTITFLMTCVIFFFFVAEQLDGIL